MHFTYFTCREFCKTDHKPDTLRRQQRCGNTREHVYLIIGMCGILILHKLLSLIHGIVSMLTMRIMLPQWSATQQSPPSSHTIVDIILLQTGSDV